MSLRPFHLAIPVSDISKAKDFMDPNLGLPRGGLMILGRLQFFGHQLVCHVGETTSFTNEVDGKDVPVPHFGILLEWEEFDNFSKKLKENNINFIIEPYLRFEGLPGEQKTMFFKDPFGNALEFKSFKKDIAIFSK